MVHNIFIYYTCNTGKIKTIVGDSLRLGEFTILVFKIVYNHPLYGY